MRVQRHQDGWEVFVESTDDPTLSEGLVVGERRLGFISGRGGLTLSNRWGRGARMRRAALALEDARRSLVRSGELVDRDLERARREEQRIGTFVVELDDGRVGRFHSYRSENPSERGGGLFRPGAEDWANDELDVGRATHADLFRGPIDERQRRASLYVPRVLPAQDEHPPIIVSHEEHLPIHSWSKRRVERRGRSAQGDRPSDVDLAYRTKADAIALVDARALGQAVPPGVIADAWDVALDAFIEARLPLQIDFVAANADHWRTRELVSSRRGRRPARKRR